MGEDALMHEWSGLFMIRAKSENFLLRVSIFDQLRDSVTPALRTLKLVFTHGYKCERFTNDEHFENIMAANLAKSNFWMLHAWTIIHNYVCCLFEFINHCAIVSGLAGF